MKQKNKAVMGLVAAGAMALGVHQAGAAIVTQSVDIAANTTWTSANEYLLDAVVFVKDGATLTIEPGTLIRGKNLSNASLIIARGSKINAVGTPAQPIVFTAQGDNHYVGPTPSAGTGVWAQKNNGVGKKWGGVIVLGSTYIATQTNTPNSTVTQPIEGISGYGALATYGGDNDLDDSGVMRYVSIRYGGFILGANNEINGLTMGGVGRATDIDHIEVYQNADDAFEFFGGTVCPKYLVAWNCTDDNFDTDEGFRGKGQFFLCVQGLLINADFNEKSDKGTEQDGAINGDANQPSSIPTWFNWTEVGLGRASGQKKNTCMNIRDGAGARFYNSLWMDFGGAPAILEGAPGGSYDSADNLALNYVNGGLYGRDVSPADGLPDSGNGYDHAAVDPDGRNTKQLELMYNVWWKMGTNTAIQCASGDTLGATWGSDDASKAFTDPGLFTDASLHNYYLDEAGGPFPSSIPGTYLSPCQTLTRELVGKSIGDGKTYYQVDVLNPLPRTGYDTAIMTAGRVPPNDGFYTPVAFIGAFGNANNWAKDWTLVSRLGMLTGGTAADNTGIVPNVSKGATDVLASLSVDNYVGIAADWYLYLDATGVGAGFWKYDPTVPAPGLPWSYCGTTLSTVTPSLPNAPLSNAFTSPAPVLPLSVLPAGTYTATLAIDLAPGGGIDAMKTFSKSVTFTK
jgi:hypothetical protein